MTVQYHGQHNRPRYVCTRLATDDGGETCQQVAGRGLDAFVSRWVLAALELSLAAAEHLEQERAAVLRLWQQRRERATYEAERVARQYRLVEPENRLVARALERTGEEQLAAQQQLEAAYHRFLATQPCLLTAPERTAIVRLAADIPALWAATTNADRKELIRQIVERVVVAAHGTSERVRVTIDWVGGTQTTDEFIRPVARWEQMSSYSVVRTRLAQWVAEGRSTAEMAQRLNAEGFRPPKRRETFTPDDVQELLRRLGLRRQPHQPAPREALGEHEW
ncbi:MAG: hypothetical protein M1118_11125 [Chloroflexi bacterium]|nr:hypothetical protein [Chloroflexota bacterium]